jgi:hypothetical protein
MNVIAESVEAFEKAAEGLMSKEVCAYDKVILIEPVDASYFDEDNHHIQQCIVEARNGQKYLSNYD